MYRFIIYFICGVLISTLSFAQTSGMKSVLDEISRNNGQLKAYQSLMAGKNLANKADNNLQDPQLSGFYLPFGEHDTDDYYEYQISQQFEFPTVYLARSKWIEKQKEVLELEYKSLRQEVLLNAKKELLELQIFQERKELEQERIERTIQIYEKGQDLSEARQIDILELKKAKLVRLQEQFELDQINIHIRNTLLIIQKLNGGNPIGIDEILSFEDLEVTAMKTLWKEKLIQDVEIQQLTAQETLAEQQVKLEKNKIFPDLNIGYNYQGVNSSYYSGFLGGLSIPIWKSKHKVKAAKANLEYTQANQTNEMAELYTRFQEDYQQYQLLRDAYEKYQKIFEDPDTEELLFEAYKSGKFSFSEYYGEVEFYRAAGDKMLKIKKELLQLKAELLKHQL